MDFLWLPNTVRPERGWAIEFWMTFPPTNRAALESKQPYDIIKDMVRYFQSFCRDTEAIHNSWYKIQEECSASRREEEWGRNIRIVS